MRFLKIFLIMIVLASGFTACDEALDINTNPLVATSADPNALLPYVIVQYSNRHVTELGTRTMDVPQHMNVCFNSPRQGNTSIFLTGNTWNMYYTQVLGNLQLIEQDAVAAGASSNNIAAIAKIFTAKSYFELSCIWEDVPFSQAINGAEFPSPSFDSQESIFRGTVSMLDEAIALIDSSPDVVADVATGDLIYGGDMDLWRRWANSLKLRILMMIRNKDTSVDSDIVATLSQPLIEDNSQAALVTYRDNTGEANAWQRLITNFFGGTAESSGVYSPARVPYELLRDSGDPRFGLLIVDPDSNGHAPIGQFTFPAPGAFAHYSNNAIRNSLPHIMFLPSEISFYRAELALKGVTSDNALEQYQNGVRQILEFWGGDIPGATATLDQAVIDDFVTSLTDPSLEDVYNQLYLESFLRPIVAWNTVRRTKFPVMDPVPGTSITTILKRFNYAPNEVAANINAPANPPTDQPMWFEN